MKKKPEPLKYFRDQYESKKKAFGGAMIAAAGPGPKKRKRNPAAPKPKQRTKWKSCFAGKC